MNIHCTLAMWLMIYAFLVGLIWWGIRHLRKDYTNSAPSCYGDYPHRNPQVHAERDCRECIYVTQCAERTPE